MRNTQYLNQNTDGTNRFKVREIRSKNFLFPFSTMKQVTMLFTEINDCLTAQNRLFLVFTKSAGRKRKVQVYHYSELYFPILSIVCRFHIPKFVQ